MSNATQPTGTGEDGQQQQQQQETVPAFIGLEFSGDSNNWVASRGGFTVASVDNRASFDETVDRAAARYMRPDGTFSPIEVGFYPCDPETGESAIPKGWEKILFRTEDAEDEEDEDEDEDENDNHGTVPERGITETVVSGGPSQPAAANTAANLPAGPVRASTGPSANDNPHSRRRRAKKHPRKSQHAKKTAEELDADLVEYFKKRPTE
ncbi:hypothetical protein GGR52DRAFT_574158 [Hypoxylon sp. FL1284]|nr:hypothetical protein GGR52DRAFT_574158 [Hypoxylon sp. FL1284]